MAGHFRKQTFSVLCLDRAWPSEEFAFQIHKRQKFYRTDFKVPKNWLDHAKGPPSPASFVSQWPTTRCLHPVTWRSGC